MRFSRKIVASVFSILLPTFAQTAPASVTTAWPAVEWEVATPESAGIDSGRLAELLAMVRRQDWRVDSIQVVRHGKLVMDAYFYPYSAGHLHDLRSVTKSVTSSLLGLSIAQGKWPDVEVPVLSQFPGREFKSVDERKKAMTLGALVDMRSGLSWTEDYSPSAASSFVQMNKTKDWVGYVLDQPMASAPGDKFNYSGGNMNVLAAMVGKAWGKRASDVARERLFQPIGISRFQWSATDPAGNTIGEADLTLDPKDMARLGLLWLHDGAWDGRRLLPEGWTGRLLSGALQASDESLYKRGFWIDSTRSYFYALGRHGQAILVDPALDMVAVITGKVADGKTNPVFFLVEQLRAMTGRSAALPENRASQAKLRALVQEIAQPGHGPVEPAKIPAARMGRTWKLESNPLGLASLRLEPDPADAGAVFLDVGFAMGGAVRLSCGLDGAYRFTIDERAEYPTQALRGRWTAPGVFEVEEEALESSVYMLFRIEFQGECVTVGYDNSQYLHGRIKSVGE